MKYLLVIVATIAVLGWSQGVTAQQAPEPDPLQTACKYLWDFGEVAGLEINNCRRTAPDEFSWRGTTVHVRLSTSQGPVNLTVRTIRSPWQVVNWAQE